MSSFQQDLSLEVNNISLLSSLECAHDSCLCAEAVVLKQDGKEDIYSLATVPDDAPEPHPDGDV